MHQVKAYVEQQVIILLAEHVNVMKEIDSKCKTAQDANIQVFVDTPLTTILLEKGQIRESIRTIPEACTMLNLPLER